MAFNPTEGTHPTIAEAEAFWTDLKASNAWMTSFGFGYLPPIFAASSEAEMLVNGWLADDGSRPGGVCLRYDTFQCLRLTGSNRLLTASWTVAPGIIVTNNTTPDVASYDPGTIWLNVFESAGQTVHSTLIKQRATQLFGSDWSSGFTWANFVSNGNQIQIAATIAVNIPAYYRNTGVGLERETDLPGGSKIRRPVQEWFVPGGQHLIMLPMEGSFIDASACSFIYYAGPLSVDTVVRLSSNPGTVGLKAPNPVTTLDTEAFTGLYIYDTDASTVVTMTARAHIVVIHEDGLSTAPIPRSVFIELDGEQFSLTQVSSQQVGADAYYTMEADVNWADLSAGPHEIRAFIEDDPEDMSILADNCLLNNTSVFSDFDFSTVDEPLGIGPGIQYSIPITPTFKSYLGPAFTHLPLHFQSFIDAPGHIFRYQLFPDIRLEVIAGGGGFFIGRPGLPLAHNYTEETALFGSEAHLTFPHHGEAIGTPLTVPYFPDHYMRVPVLRWDDDFRQAGPEADADAAVLQLAAPFTIFRVQAHRRPSGDPSVVSPSEPAISIEFGYRPESDPGTFSALAVLTIPAGHTSSQVVRPDWLNSDGRALYYRVLDGDPNQATRINVECNICRPWFGLLQAGTGAVFSSPAIDGVHNFYPRDILMALLNQATDSGQSDVVPTL